MSRLNGSRSWVHSSSSFSHAAFSFAIVAARSCFVASHASVLPSRRFAIATAAAFASPLIPTVIFLTSPMFAWSASTWMIFASFGQ